MTTEPDLFDSVEAASKVVRAAMERAAQRLGYTWSQAQVLLILHKRGPTPIGLVAKLLIQEPQSTTELIDRLERAGLLQRLRHPTDRRVVLVELTEAGHAVVQRISAPLVMAKAQLMFAVAPEDRSALARGLKAIIVAGGQAVGDRYDLSAWLSD